MIFQKFLKYSFLIMFVLAGMAGFNSLRASEVSVQHNVHFNRPYFSDPAVSPDGKHIAYAGNNSVKIWDIKGNCIGSFIDKSPYINPPNEFKFWQPNRNVNTVAFLSDNKHVAVSVFPRRVYILDLTGRLVRKYKVKKLIISRDLREWSKISQIHYFPGGNFLLTYEPGGDDIVLRNKNYEKIKRIPLNRTTSASNYIIRISPDGKFFVVAQDVARSTKNGWKTYMRLFDNKGFLVRNISSDRPGKVATPYGKHKKIFFFPDWMEFSPDSRYLIYMNTYHAGRFRDPSDRKKYFGGRIRRVEISSGREKEFWIPDTKYRITRLFHNKDKRTYTGVSSRAVYILSKDGKVLGEKMHQKVKHLHRNGRSYNRMFTSSHQQIPGRGAIILGNCSDPDRGFVLYTRAGVMKKFNSYPLYAPKKVSVSLNGEYLSFEIERAKKSVFFDVRNNRVSLKNSSVYFDNINKPYSLKHDRRKYQNTITYDSGSISYSQREHSYMFLMPLPNRKYAEIKNGFTLYNLDGEALRRYPRAKITLGTAVAGDLTYYVEPLTWPKVKYVLLKNMHGKQLLKKLTGAFFSSTWVVSPDGKYFAGGHDSQGFIQVYTKKGKMVHRISDLIAGQVQSLAMTKNNRYLVALGRMGTVKIIDLKNEKRRIEVSFFTGNGFVVSDNQGRFDCSDNALEKVSVVKNGKNQTGTVKQKARVKGLLWKFFKGQ